MKMTKEELYKKRVDVFRKYDNIKLAASELGIAVCSLTQYFNRIGYDFKKYTALKGNINKDGVSYTYDQEVFKKDKEFYSYFIGFFLADGSRKKGIRNQVTFELAKKDKTLLELFVQKICPNKPIIDVNGRDSCYVTFNAKMIGDILDFHNLHSNKTAECEIKNLDSLDQNHFLRGYFDGDGCVGIGNKIYGYLQVSILGNLGNKNCMSSILTDAEIAHKIYHDSEKNNGNFYVIKISDAQSNILDFYNYIYNNSNYYLSRKKDKFVFHKQELNDKKID